MLTYPLDKLGGCPFHTEYTRGDLLLSDNSADDILLPQVGGVGNLG